jgi:hypothetical protein
MEQGIAYREFTEDEVCAILHGLKKYQESSDNFFNDPDTKLRAINDLMAYFHTLSIPDNPALKRINIQVSINELEWLSNSLVDYEINNDTRDYDLMGLEKFKSRIQKILEEVKKE